MTGGVALWDLPTLLSEAEAHYLRQGLESYWQAESEHIASALSSISKPLSERYISKSVLGVGGSGIVIRLGDSLFPQRDKALKFPRPVPGKIELVADMLAKEISYLANFRHPSVVSVHDYGALHSVGAYPTLPYYIMDCVDGRSSQAYLKSHKAPDEGFRHLALGLARLLAYLHTGEVEGFAHLDIKPDNILVATDGRPVIIDLGTCKRLAREDTLTIVACTRSFAHPELVRRLSRDPSDLNRARGELARADIVARWDLWAYGLTLLSWLGIAHEDGTVSGDATYHKLGSYTRKFFLLLIARMLTYNLPLWLAKRVGLSEAFLKDFPLQSSPDLCEVLDRLDSSKGPLSRIPEITDGNAGTIQAAPGVHVANTPALQAVFQHRLYRRLNTTSQLGLVSQVYPGAKHTRREHSLGTYANTVRMLCALYADPYSPLFRQIITEEDCRAVLLASLLHDLGQFPLAHDLEEIDDRIFNHSDLSVAMLRGEWATKKRGGRRISFDSLQPVFVLWKTTSLRVIGIINAKATGSGYPRRDRLLRSLFSGPIDGDKADYLQRDARHTDVPYPFGVDFDRLFRCLTTVVIPRVEGGATDVPCVGVHSKGRIAAEFLTLARYAMFAQVYWHHAVRAQKAMLQRAVSALLAEFGGDIATEQFKSEFIEMIASLPESLYEKASRLFPEVEDERKPTMGIGRGSDLAPTDAAVLTWLRDRLAEAERPEVALLEGILYRRLYKRLWVISHDMDARRWRAITEAWDGLGRFKKHKAASAFERTIAGLLRPERMATTGLSAEEAIATVRQRAAAHQPWLLIDIPGGRPGSEVGLQYVLEGQRRQLRKDDRSVGDLQAAAIWDQYGRELRRAAGKIRVFCDPDLVETVEVSVSMEEGLQALEDTLDQLKV